ncbi:hypothetical protein HDE_00882 [Halotydeus destructor]|nr:hypothetical protein HDE_00882 [Halotydeus destructor]
MGFVGLLSLLVDQCSSKLAVPCSVAEFQTLRVYIDGDAILYHLCKSLKPSDEADVIGEAFLHLIKREIESCLLTMPKARDIKMTIAFDGRAGSLKMETLLKRRTKAALAAKTGIHTLTHKFRLDFTLRRETKQWIVDNQKALVDHFLSMAIRTSLTLLLWSEDGEAESKLMYELFLDLAGADYDVHRDFSYFMTTDTDIVVLTLLALEKHMESVFYVRLFSEKTNDPCFEISSVMAKLREYAPKSMTFWTIALMTLGNDYMVSELESSRQLDCLEVLGRALKEFPAQTPFSSFELYNFIVKSSCGREPLCSGDHFSRVLNYYTAHVKNQ